MRHLHRPEISLARNATQDTASNFHDMLECPKYDVFADKNHSCVLGGRSYSFALSDVEFGSMLMMGNEFLTDCLAVTGFSIAHIMGYHFKSGEWGQHPRCGSVITCVLGEHSTLGARSLFARVENFFTVHGDSHPGYASVSWFSEPTYLYDDNPLGARVTLNGTDIAAEFGCVVRITQIDPTQIMVEPEPETSSFIMIRDSGYNTRRTP